MAKKKSGTGKRKKRKSAQKVDLKAHVVKAGAGPIIVHQEGAVHLHRTVQLIKSLGVQAGVAINPATPAAALEEIRGQASLFKVLGSYPRATV